MDDQNVSEEERALTMDDRDVSEEERCFDDITPDSLMITS